MAINPNVPLMASDQADVIRIFLDMMIANERSSHESEVSAAQPFGPCDDVANSMLWGELPECE